MLLSWIPVSPSMTPEQLPFDTVMDTVCRPSVTLACVVPRTETGASDLL